MVAVNPPDSVIRPDTRPINSGHTRDRTPGVRTIQCSVQVVGGTDAGGQCHIALCVPISFDDQTAQFGREDTTLVRLTSIQ